MNEITNLISKTLLVPVGKTGKVSKSTEKVASVMRDASAIATISAAVYGRGTTKKVAMLQLQGLHTVEFFTDRDAIDGGEWADFLMALVARHGERTYNPVAMRGKSGVLTYLRTTQQAIELKGACDGWTDSLQRKVATVEEDIANTERLVLAALEAAKVAKEEIEIETEAE